MSRARRKVGSARRLRHVGTTLCHLAKLCDVNGISAAVLAHPAALVGRSPAERCHAAAVVGSWLTRAHRRAHVPPNSHEFHELAWQPPAVTDTLQELVLRLTDLAPFALAACIAGCGGQYVTRGADLYAGGRYIEAAEVFERTERRLDASGAAERARYGLYRGATLLALGDPVRAEHWLNFCRDIVKTEGGALSSEDRAMLERAFGVLASHTPAATPPAEGAAVASSQTFPAWTPPARR